MKENSRTYIRDGCVDVRWLNFICVDTRFLVEYWSSNANKIIGDV